MEAKKEESFPQIAQNCADFCEGGTKQEEAKQKGKFLTESTEF